MRRDRDAVGVVPWGFKVETLTESQGDEGIASLHFLNGWTALAFPDRSVDTRYNSKSVFVFEGEFNFHDVRALARQTYPEVFQRFSFPVELKEDRT